MDEPSSREIERVLLHLADARDRARAAGARLASESAEAHLVEALARTEEQLKRLDRELRQGTYYATPGRTTATSDAPALL